MDESVQESSSRDYNSLSPKSSSVFEFDTYDTLFVEYEVNNLSLSQRQV